MNAPASGERPSAPGDRTAALFVEYRRTGDRRLRNQLVELHRHLADYHVRRFTRRGVPEEDLRQISLLAVISAVERFDPSLDVAVSTFASRTIEGELKRHLRDRTWIVRPPRRAQELHLALRRADEELGHRLGRAPTIAELAVEVDDTVDHVLEALEAGVAHHPASLDHPQNEPSDEARPLSERVLGTAEPGFGQVELREVVADLLEGLPEREREVIRLRFYENLTQPEIAARMGVSQSYLSRIIRRTLVDLRDRIADPGLDD